MTVGKHTAGLVDIQKIVFAVCESNNGGCACKVQKINLASSGFGAQPRGARCDERYDVALAVLCAIVRANAEADEIQAPTPPLEGTVRDQGGDRRGDHG